MMMFIKIESVCFGRRLVHFEVFYPNVRLELGMHGEPS
jgi:hypothetical protein